MLAVSARTSLILLLCSIAQICQATNGFCSNYHGQHEFLFRVSTTTVVEHSSFLSLNELLYCPGSQETHPGAHAREITPKSRLLLKESPFLYVARDEDGQIPESYIVSSLLSLRPPQQQELLKLCNDQILFSQGSMLDSAVSCFSFYGLNIEHGAAVFLNSSRITHSCLPNSEWHWNATSGSLTVVAMKDIQAGGEVTISYLKDIGFRRTASERQNYLGSTCHCPACASGSMFSDASDRRRILMNQLFENVLERENNKGLTTDHLWQNYYDGLKLHDLLEEEGLQGWEMAMSYNIMGSAMSRYGDHEWADYYFAKEREFYSMFTSPPEETAPGTESKWAQQLHALWSAINRGRREFLNW